MNPQEPARKNDKAAKSILQEELEENIKLSRLNNKSESSRKQIWKPKKLLTRMKKWNTEKERNKE